MVMMAGCCRLLAKREEKEGKKERKKKGREEGKRKARERERESWTELLKLLELPNTCNEMIEFVHYQNYLHKTIKEDK